jgi:hypothetical protein
MNICECGLLLETCHAIRRCVCVIGCGNLVSILDALYPTSVLRSVEVTGKERLLPCLSMWCGVYWLTRAFKSEVLKHLSVHSRFSQSVSSLQYALRYGSLRQVPTPIASHLKANPPHLLWIDGFFGVDASSARGTNNNKEVKDRQRLHCIFVIPVALWVSVGNGP